MAFLRVIAIFFAIAATEAQRPTLDEWKEGQAEDQADSAAAAAKQKKMAAVDKAVTMLETLQAQVLDEGEKEAASYNKFACFCKDTTAEKSDAIEKGEDEQESLIAEITTLSGSRDKLDGTIQKCEEDIEDAEKEMKEAVAERAGTKKVYDANKADMEGAIYALEQAIKTLKASKTPSLLQFQKVSETVQTAAILADALGLGSQGQKAKLAAFLQQPANDNAVPMEDYKFHSNDIIETLEGLLKDFIDEKNTVDADEVKSVQEHNIFMEEKKNFVKQTNKKMADAKEKRENTIADIESNSKELSTVEATLRDDKEYLMALSKMCSDKAKTWDQRSKVRQDELSTLTQAIGIVKGSVAEKTSAATLRFAQTAVSVRVANAQASNKAFMQQIEAEAEAADAGASFVQLKSIRKLRGAGPTKDGRLVVQELLREKGQELKSTLLTALASQIKGSDPFAKIKTLIGELIERLLQEAANEANQKGWCDKAMADATQKREYAAEEIATLNAEMGKLEATRDQLAEDLSVLEDEIEELTTKREEAVKMRAEEKAENNATVVEAQEGLDALDMCITLLDHFYKTVKKETVDLSLAQQSPMEDAPDAGFEIGEAYTGAQSESGGIMGMLEVMKSDFVRTIEETEKAEAQAEQEHLEFMTETGKSLAEKEQAETEKTNQKDDAEEKLQTADESLASETKILRGAIKELMQLKPTCIDTGMSYEERVARREEEIAALKKALCILGNYAEYGPDGAADGC